MEPDMTEYPIDTNILIYYLAGPLPPEEKPQVDKILQDSFNISIITKIELLGWKAILRKDWSWLGTCWTAPGAFPLLTHLRKRRSRSGGLLRYHFPMP